MLYFDVYVYIFIYLFIISLFVYIFDIYGSDEVILISGFVNNPGKEKMILLDKTLLEELLRLKENGGI